MRHQKACQIPTFATFPIARKTFQEETPFAEIKGRGKSFWRPEIAEARHGGEGEITLCIFGENTKKEIGGRRVTHTKAGCRGQVKRERPSVRRNYEGKERKYTGTCMEARKQNILLYLNPSSGGSDVSRLHESLHQSILFILCPSSALYIASSGAINIINQWL